MTDTNDTRKRAGDSVSEFEPRVLRSRRPNLSETSSSSERRDGERNSKKGDRPETQSKSECPICKASYDEIADFSILHPCGHSFCYECIKYWLEPDEGRACPTCRVPGTFLMRGFDDGSPEKKLVSELRSDYTIKSLAARASTVPLTEEVEVLRHAVHQYRARIARYTEQNYQPQLPTRGCAAQRHRQREMEIRNMEYRTNVQTLAKLQMLIDNSNSISRKDLVSDPVFRKLIYKFRLEWGSVERNELEVRFTPLVASSDPGATDRRLRPWLLKELGLLLTSRTNNARLFKREVQGHANEILELCKTTPLQTPDFDEKLSKLVRLSRNNPRARRDAYVEIFQRELFEFATSNLTMEQFFGISRYSLPESIRRSNVRSAETITIDDFEDLSDDDVQLVSEPSTSGTRNTGESNYVREEALSTDSDDDSNFYMHPSCRLDDSHINLNRRNDPLRHAHELFPFNFSQGDIFRQIFPGGYPMGTFGYSNFTPHPPHIAPRTTKPGPSRRTVEEVDLSSDDEQSSTSNSRSSAHISSQNRQFVAGPNDTIVLGLDTPKPSGSNNFVNVTSSDLPSSSNDLGNMPGLKHEPLDATIAIGTEDTSSHAVLSVDEKQHDGVQNRNDDSTIESAHKKKKKAKKGSKSKKETKEELLQTAKTATGKDLQKIMHFAKKLLRACEKNMESRTDAEREELSRSDERRRSSGRSSSHRHRSTSRNRPRSETTYHDSLPSDRHHDRRSRRRSCSEDPQRRRSVQHGYSRRRSRSNARRTSGEGYHSRHRSSRRSGSSKHRSPSRERPLKTDKSSKRKNSSQENRPEDRSSYEASISRNEEGSSCSQAANTAANNTANHVPERQDKSMVDQPPRLSDGDPAAADLLP